ncbi:hypothetical protein GCM10017044_23160 [Kordiimonas sediminis]|uniref:Polymer-forming cytoskeletal protein n=1 Tax=Kordiimonas sediminis TaxID=1735581 RepID=A0A919AUL4_9PROT|nr:polymer-forming cytoskeletal protein [Kordiimonas sediminis]GHF27464.1 hypothetical protein GCM10017044_23160 [Kordiimonas sediminis]
MKKRTLSNPGSGLAPSHTPSIIGADVEITGNVKTSGELQLDGAISGDLSCGGLVMGETGKVKGLISAESVTIRGHVQGEIRSKSVRLESTATVDGDVYHENLSVESGAKLNGRFAHSSDLSAAPAPKSADELAAPSFLKPKADAAE